MRSLVLASGSAYRARLLGRLGLAFEARAGDIDETPLAGERPAELVARLSRAKARAAASSCADALVIGSDQVGELDGRVLGKPMSEDRACEQLLAASGRSVRFLTGLCVIDARSGRALEAVETCTVRFRRLDAATVRSYVSRERPLDCAGSFKVEGLGIALFESIETSDPTALEGLPLIRLCEFLAELGSPVLG